jgi:predicted DNA-binding transcriptional regulator YafY
MPINRNALIRYKTIDSCLQRRQRRWTLQDLMDACSDALYEYEGSDRGVSVRTIQTDIQNMRSEKLGYNAPIIVLEKKYYIYEDPTYSITKIPMTSQDLVMMGEVVEILKQFKSFSHFQDLTSVVNKLQDKIHVSKTQNMSIIDFEKNENLKGLDWLDELYNAISSKQVIRITYQSFKARGAQSFHFHPHLLKEYRNRWFILGLRDKGVEPQILALDRIQGIEKMSGFKFVSSEHINETYFKDMIGVTRSLNQKPAKVRFWMDRKNAPYVITKPLHFSQTIIEQQNEGYIFEMTVLLNYELERVILGYGKAIHVLCPRLLRKNIFNHLQGALRLYKLNDNENIDID